MEEPLRGYFRGAMVTKVAALLCEGGVAVLPTDTIYGLHCAASNAEAAKSIRRLKGRGSGAGLILLASDMEMVDRLVSRWPQGVRELLSRAWPAPLTAILTASKGVDPSLAPGGTVAVRIPALPELRRCVKLIGHPLVSTSVNRSGQKPMTRITDIIIEFPDLSAYMSRRGRPSANPSTIVDMTASPPKLLRPGRHPWPLR